MVISLNFHTCHAELLSLLLQMEKPRPPVVCSRTRACPAVPDVSLCLEHMPALPLGLCGSGLLASHS